MLKIKNFTLTYDEPVLENVNLSFKSGEITVLTGTSGSGKSSLLKVIKMVLFHIFNQRQLNEISKTELIVPYQKHSKKSQTLPESSDLICQNYRYKHRDNKDNIFDFNLGLDKL